MGDNYSDGGPAFPRDHASDGHNGMTLRDYFAAKAMQAQMAALVGSANSSSIDRSMRIAGVNTPLELFAKNAYAQADAMLKERAK